jgi:wobble nucleotide-excising tRNase
MKKRKNKKQKKLSKPRGCLHDWVEKGNEAPYGLEECRFCGKTRER